MKMFVRGFINVFYKVLSVFRKKEGVVLIFSRHSQSFENLPIIEQALQKSGVPCKVINEDINFCNIYILSSAKVVCIDQATLLTSNIKISDATQVIQIWHAGGAFKKFGFDASTGTLADEQRIRRIHGNVNWIVTSSKKVLQTYSNAFRLPIEHVLPFGIPRTDRYINTQGSNYRIIKTILYAPTFRVDKYNQRVVNDFALAVNVLKTLEKKDFRIAIRLHPSVHTQIEELDVLDWSSKSLKAALSQTDILITDYSSIIFDYSLFNGKIFWYVKDLNTYEGERGIYFNPLVDYPKYASTDLFSLCKLIEANPMENCSVIRKKFMNACDGHSTDRVTNFIKELL